MQFGITAAAKWFWSGSNELRPGRRRERLYWLVLKAGDVSYMSRRFHLLLNGNQMFAPSCRALVG